MNVLKTWGTPLLVAAMLAACAAPSPAPVLLTLPPAATPLASAEPGTAGTSGTAASAPLLAGAEPGTAGTSGTAASAPLLAVRRVNIPEYLVARRVRYRADASTLAEWPNTFWAERIEIGVSREFVFALRQQLPGWALCDTTCGDAVPVLSLQVDLLPMDYVRSAGRLQARARIVLSSGSVPPRELKTLEASYDLPAGGDTPQAHAQAISVLIRQVAQAVAPLVVSAPR